MLMIVMLFVGTVGIIVEHDGTAVFVLCEQIYLKIVGNLLSYIALAITQNIYKGVYLCADMKR